MPFQRERRDPNAAPCARAANQKEVLDVILFTRGNRFQCTPFVPAVNPPAALRHVAVKGHRRLGQRPAAIASSMPFRCTTIQGV